MTAGTADRVCSAVISIGFAQREGWLPDWFLQQHTLHNGLPQRSPGVVIAAYGLNQLYLGCLRVVPGLARFTNNGERYGLKAVV